MRTFVFEGTLGLEVERRNRTSMMCDVGAEMWSDVCKVALIGNAKKVKRYDGRGVACRPQLSFLWVSQLARGIAIAATIVIRTNGQQCGARVFNVKCK